MRGDSIDRVTQALCGGDDTLFRQYVAAGSARLSAPDSDGSTLLTLAVQCDRADLVALCLELGVRPDLPTDDCGYTLLRTAIESSGATSLEIVRMLLAHGAAPTGVRDGILYPVPIVVAAIHGMRDKLLALLDAGADVDEREPEDGETALMAAARFGYREIVVLLLERGADTRLQDQTIGQSALDLALQSTAEGATAIIELLRHHRGASAALDDSDGDVSLARHFLVECYDAEDRRILHVAARDGDLTAIQLLLDKGHDPNAREPEVADTPLIEAARMAELPAVELLLERGADPTSKNREGDTAKDLVSSLLSTETRRSWRNSYRRILKLLR